MEELWQRIILRDSGTSHPILNKKRIRKYLEKDGDINFKPYYGEFSGISLLFLSIETRNYCVCKYLLENGADPNNYTHQYKPALHKSVDTNNCKIVKLLLKYGADVNQIHDFGTPLHYSAKKGNISMCILLMKYGADPYIRCGYSNKTSYEVSKNKQIADILIPPIVLPVSVSSIKKLENDECVICFDNERSRAIATCGHYCMCDQCAFTILETTQVAHCPICRCSFNATDLIKIIIP
ncbi:hypothetical protein COU54_01400 [Candidatus Pacearchaeota archaeon CG10_big_fil_rev_8_21_14_0_10_31_24]|nr:MAG: hypothetical protein COU54_01400 [Candidatus Pacearchaeota archaeon CG10_big_fil_rev_8_21_14_0_10_31_24]